MLFIGIGSELQLLFCTTIEAFHQGMMDSREALD